MPLLGGSECAPATVCVEAALCDGDLIECPLRRARLPPPVCRAAVDVCENDTLCAGVDGADSCPDVARPPVVDGTPCLVAGDADCFEQVLCDGVNIVCPRGTFIAGGHSV